MSLRTKFVTDLSHLDVGPHMFACRERAAILLGPPVYLHPHTAVGCDVAISAKEASQRPGWSPTRSTTCSLHLLSTPPPSLSAETMIQEYQLNHKHTETSDTSE
jgi:hypothetical protein